MSKEFVKQCFDQLAARESIAVRPSTLTDEDLEQFEEAHDVTFPAAYREFLSVCAYDADLTLSGLLDNFMFEDDAEVTLWLPGQPEGAELSNLAALYENFPLLLEGGYLPVGRINEDGILCLESETGRVFLADGEELYDCESAEDVQDAAILLLEDFEPVLKCFFLGEKQNCVDDEDE